MNFKRFFLITICLIFSIIPLWSADLTATIQEVSGKVEMKKAGGAWTTVSAGDVLNAGDSISTGFNSKAVMVLGDSSVLVAKDLTRLTLSELFEKEGTVVTDLFLDVGNIRTEVHSSESVSHDFQVRNANSTASVRGTVLDVEILGDGQGMKVMAWDGMAEVTDLWTGRKAYVGEQKKEKKKSGDSSDEGGDEESGGDESAAEGESDGGSDSKASQDMGLPPEPPAEIAAAPLLASGTGGAIVSSMSSAIAASTVTVSTKPPAPGNISTGGGTSASTETAAAAAAAAEEIGTTTVVTPTTSSISIQVVWPD